MNYQEQKLAEYINPIQTLNREELIETCKLYKENLPHITSGEELYIILPNRIIKSNIDFTKFEYQDLSHLISVLTERGEDASLLLKLDKSLYKNH